jgi:dUTP pyrophosphatase
MYHTLGYESRGEDNYTIRNGDRIAQCKIAIVPKVKIVEVDELDETERGEGGFGSTGR